MLKNENEIYKEIPQKTKKLLDHLRQHPIVYKKIKIWDAVANSKEDMAEILPVVEEFTVLLSQDYTSRRYRTAYYLLSNGELADGFSWDNFQVYYKVGSQLERTELEIESLKSILELDKIDSEILRNGLTETKGLAHYWMSMFSIPNLDSDAVVKALISGERLHINKDWQIRDCLHKDGYYSNSAYLGNEFKRWLESLPIKDLMTGDFMELQAKEILENIAMLQGMGE